MNRLAKPKAQTPFGIARKPIGVGRPSSDLAFFIGVAFFDRHTSNTMEILDVTNNQFYRRKRSLQ